MPCRWLLERDFFFFFFFFFFFKKNTAKADFKADWEVLKAKTSPEELAAAYQAMNIPGRRLE